MRVGSGSYPLNVSKDRSLLLLVSGGGRMLSVTGGTTRVGPSSWMMKSKLDINIILLEVQIYHLIYY